MLYITWCSADIFLESVLAWRCYTGATLCTFRWPPTAAVETFRLALARLPVLDLAADLTKRPFLALLFARLAMVVGFAQVEVIQVVA